jgi:hypothetical protein
MGISIPRRRLEEVLERALLVAESDAELDPLWEQRVKRIGECPSRSYVAALGTALLAKATEPAIDALTVKAKAGPNAYSMRGVAKVLVEKAPIYGYHLGRTGPEPLNNQPWFGSDRVDRFQNVRADAAPFHRDMVRFLSDLNRGSQEDAFAGLVAFLRLRIEFAETLRQAERSLSLRASDDIAELIAALEIFVHQDTEGGRRGQALVAALFELAHEEVHLAGINDPRSLDVSVAQEGRVILGAEVKQKPVLESAVLHLAEEAAAEEIDKAVLVALSSDQRPLDQERLRLQALEESGVVIDVWIGVRELVTQVVLQAPVTAVEFARDLPSVYLRRMQEHGVSEAGQRYWADLTPGFSREAP